MRGKKRHRRVAPVIHTTLRRLMGIELEDRHQLNRSDPEIDQVWNLLYKPCIGASLFRSYSRTRMPGKTADMQLVDDCLHEWSSQWMITLPVIGTGISNYAFHRNCRVVAPALLWNSDR